MHRGTVVLIGVLVGLIAATASGALLRVGGSDAGETAFYFSVATKNTAATGTFAGDFIAIFGSGTFGDNSVDGTGVFSISTGLPPSSSNSVASGTWTATQFVSFVSFGIANLRAEGGILVIRVSLSFDDGSTTSGVTLTTTCHVGTVPPGSPAEGVTLSGPVVFDHSVAGITTFSAPPED